MFVFGKASVTNLLMSDRYVVGIPPVPAILVPHLYCKKVLYKTANAAGFA